MPSRSAALCSASTRPGPPPEASTVSPPQNLNLPPTLKACRIAGADDDHVLLIHGVSFYFASRSLLSNLRSLELHATASAGSLSPMAQFVAPHRLHTPAHAKALTRPVSK